MQTVERYERKGAALTPCGLRRQDRTEKEIKRTIAGAEDCEVLGIFISSGPARRLGRCLKAGLFRGRDTIEARWLVPSRPTNTNPFMPRHYMSRSKRVSMLSGALGDLRIGGKEML